MSSFPEKYELINLFESEPKLLDPDNDWFDNTVEVDFITNSDKVKCILSAAYGDFDLLWIKNDEKILELHMSHVKEFKIHTEEKKEYLLLKFVEDSHFKDFMLCLKPSIKVIWGSDLS